MAFTTRLYDGETDDPIEGEYKVDLSIQWTPENVVLEQDLRDKDGGQLTYGEGHAFPFTFTYDAVGRYDMELVATYYDYSNDVVNDEGPIMVRSAGEILVEEYTCQYPYVTGAPTVSPAPVAPPHCCCCSCSN